MFQLRDPDVAPNDQVRVQDLAPNEQVPARRTAPPRKSRSGGLQEKKSLMEISSKFLDDFNPVNIFLIFNIQRLRNPCMA